MTDALKVYPYDIDLRNARAEAYAAMGRSDLAAPDLAMAHTHKITPVQNSSVTP
jgi:hypothetical protein